MFTATSADVTFHHMSLHSCSYAEDTICFLNIHEKLCAILNQIYSFSILRENTSALQHTKTQQNHFTVHVAALDWNLVNV